MRPDVEPGALDVVGGPQTDGLRLGEGLVERHALVEDTPRDPECADPVGGAAMHHHRTLGALEQDPRSVEHVVGQCIGTVPREGDVVQAELRDDALFVEVPQLAREAQVDDRAQASFLGQAEVLRGGLTGEVDAVQGVQLLDRATDVRSEDLGVLRRVRSGLLPIVGAVATGEEEERGFGDS